MAKRVFRSNSWTPAAVADTTAFSAKGYMAIAGGTGTQRLNVSEIYLGGQATVSSPTNMVVSRDSTVGITGAALGAGETEGPLDPATALLATPPALFTSATTQPQRSATAGLLNLAFNAFGGIVRWVAYDATEQLVILGNTASFGELSLSCFTGGTPGLLGAHIIYEPL